MNRIYISRNLTYISTEFGVSVFVATADRI